MVRAISPQSLTDQEILRYADRSNTEVAELCRRLEAYQDLAVAMEERYKAVILRINEYSQSIADTSERLEIEIKKLSDLSGDLFSKAGLTK